MDVHSLLSSAQDRQLWRSLCKSVGKPREDCVLNCVNICKSFLLCLFYHITKCMYFEILANKYLKVQKHTSMTFLSLVRVHPAPFHRLKSTSVPGKKCFNFLCSFSLASLLSIWESLIDFRPTLFIFVHIVFKTIHHGQLISNTKVSRVDSSIIDV